VPVSVPALTPAFTAQTVAAAIIAPITVPPLVVSASAKPFSPWPAQFAIFETISAALVLMLAFDHSALVWSSAIGRTVAFERTPATSGAENMSGAGIGIEPQNTSFRRHPLQPVVHLAVGSLKWTFGIVETSRVAAPHLRENSIKRLHLARIEIVALVPVVIKLRASGGDCERKANQAEGPCERAGTHGAFLVRRK
jgi:hypothetical protein